MTDGTGARQRLVDRLTTTPPPEPVYRALVRVRRWLRRLREALLPADAVLVERTLTALEIRALGVAADLDLAERLAGGPRSTGELATGLGLDPGRLDRLLRLLDAVDVVRRRRDGRWSTTRIGAALREEHTRSARSWVRFFGGREQFHLLAELDAPIEGVGPAPAVLHGASFFEWTAREPTVAERFDAAMADGSRLTGPMIAAVVDWSDTEVVCDVGGGTGRVLASILGEHPHVRGILFDLPSVVDALDVLPGDVAERVEVVGGDFFSGLPSADTMLLVAVLHDWGDDEVRRILDRCAAALSPGGRVVVVDQVLEPSRPVFLEHHADVLMMLLTEGGRERSVDDLRRLAAPAGLGVGRRWRLLNLQAVELVPGASADRAS